MSYQEKRKFCPECGRYVIAKREGANHILHLIISIFTLGFWLPIWALSTVRFGGWFCGVCGSKRVRSKQ